MRRLAVLLGALLLSACHPPAPVELTEASPAPPPAPRRLRIVATFAPIYCFAKNVVGSLADVSMLVPPGVDPARFQPTPADLQALARADVVVENGFGFEPWLDRLVPSGLKPGAVRIVAARGVRPPGSGMRTPAPGAPPPASDDLSLPGQANPYVWLDPLMAITEVQNIRDRLMVRDPVNAEEYLRQENEYESALRDLDTDIGEDLVDRPRRDLFCTDHAFDWFLDRYEFRAAGYASTPAAAAAEAEAAHAQAVLVSATEARAISNGTGLPAVLVNPMCSGSASADFYETVMRANTEALRQALQ